MVTNEFIKQVSLIYDEYTEEILRQHRNSLPSLIKIETGKNYTTFKNLCNILHQLNLTEINQIKLYIKVQYEEMWKIPYYSKYKAKTIPVSFFYTKQAIDRFINFLQYKKYKVGEKKFEKYLDIYVTLPLVKDENYLSLNEDIRVIVLTLKQILKENGSINIDDLINTVINIEQRNIQTQSMYSICPAYLILNPNLILDDPKIYSIFKTKIDNIKKDIKNRGMSYISKLQLKKDELINTLNLSVQEKEIIIPYI